MKLIDRFEVGLGAGGAFGRVLRATDRITGQILAAKTFRLDALEHGSYIQFIDECVKRLILPYHINVASAQFALHTAEGPFLFTDWVEGHPLADQGATTAATRVKLVADIAAGLEHIHRHQLLHLDLHPHNIVIRDTDSGPSAVITDFGLSKWLGGREDTAVQGGHRFYVAPEVLTRGRGGPAADIFSLGVVAYEMAVGQLPFPHSSNDEFLRAVKAGIRSRIVSVKPDQLATVITRCLEPEPQRRYASCQEVLQGLGVDSSPLGEESSRAWSYQRPQMVSRSDFGAPSERERHLLCIAISLLYAGAWGTAIQLLQILARERPNPEVLYFLANGLRMMSLEAQEIVRVALEMAPEDERLLALAGGPKNSGSSGPPDATAPLKIRLRVRQASVRFLANRFGVGAEAILDEWISEDDLQGKGIAAATGHPRWRFFVSIPGVDTGFFLFVYLGTDEEAAWRNVTAMRQMNIAYSKAKELGDPVMLEAERHGGRGRPVPIDPEDPVVSDGWCFFIGWYTRQDPDMEESLAGIGNPRKSHSESIRKWCTSVDSVLERVCRKIRL